jgi:hypothetical protein
MQHPDFTQQLASDRQARYRAQAAGNRLTQPARTGDGRVSHSDRRAADPMNESNSAVRRETKKPIGFVAVHIDQQVSEKSAEARSKRSQSPQCISSS